MINGYSGNPINFHDKVTYSCTFGHWFDDDRDRKEYSIECMESGFFDEPLQWPKCVKSKSFYHEHGVAQLEQPELGGLRRGLRN